MPVYLRYCRAVSAELFGTFFIRFLDEFVGLGVSRFHPRKEGCAQIEAHSAVIIEDIDDFIVGIQNTSDWICGVTFKIDAVVPIVKRGGTFLGFDDF